MVPLFSLGLRGVCGAQCLLGNWFIARQAGKARLGSTDLRHGGAKNLGGSARRLAFDWFSPGSIAPAMVTWTATKRVEIIKYLLKIKCV